jgi:VIT1/CCC1 family predicted Fe2+/Mn2+ transporter
MTDDGPLPTAEQVAAAGRGEQAHPGEPHAGGGAGRLNWLRAGVLGALLPLVAILLPPATWRVPVTFVAVLAALALTGALSARIGGSNPRRAVVRVLIGGAAGLALTYGIGHLSGTAIS